MPQVSSRSTRQLLRRSVPLGRGAKRTLIILGVMVVLLATGIVPPPSRRFSLRARWCCRVLTVSQAYGSISWTTVVLIAGMIPLSTAFTKTGAADLLAGLLSMIGDSGPYVALAALGVPTLVLSQLISNAATVLILAPIAMSSRRLDVSMQPFLMGLAVVAAAAFLTPVATPANLMVMDRRATDSPTTGGSACRSRSSSSRWACSTSADLAF